MLNCNIGNEAGKEQYVLEMPEKSQLKRSMFRWRNQVFPRNPSFQHEINLESDYFKLRGTPILIQDTI